MHHAMCRVYVLDRGAKRFSSTRLPVSKTPHASGWCGTRRHRGLGAGTDAGDRRRTHLTAAADRAASRTGDIVAVTLIDHKACLVNLATRGTFVVVERHSSFSSSLLVLLSDDLPVVRLAARSACRWTWRCSWSSRSPSTRDASDLAFPHPQLEIQQCRGPSQLYSARPRQKVRSSRPVSV
jgi:hypothetical protein